MSLLAASLISGSHSQGLAHQHRHRGGHAALAGCAEGGADQGVDGLGTVGVGQHHGVVLGAHHRLHALAVLAAQVVDVGADLGRANERDRLDIRVGADAIDHLLAAMHHVEHAGRHASLQRQLDQHHGRQRVLLGRFEHEGVAADDGHREHPQRDHRREVERGDAGAHADRLAQGIGIDAAGDVFGELTHLQGADGGGVLDHFQAAEDIALGVGNGLALFGAEGHGDALAVFADQCLQLEHDAHARADRSVAPGLEGTLGSGHRGVHFLDGGERHPRQHLLGRRVDDVTPFGGLRLDPLAVDQQLDLLDLGLVGRLGCVHLRSPRNYCRNEDAYAGANTGWRLGAEFEYRCANIQQECTKKPDHHAKRPHLPERAELGRPQVLS
ncbi:hypothetical protein OKW51_001894 [Pseudomonas hunanensis]|nr:hypothetical protein [Pseudomonas hunanensis]